MLTTSYTFTWICVVTTNSQLKISKLCATSAWIRFVQILSTQIETHVDNISLHYLTDPISSVSQFDPKTCEGSAAISENVFGAISLVYSTVHATEWSMKFIVWCNFQLKISSIDVTCFQNKSVSIQCEQFISPKTVKCCRRDPWKRNHVQTL